MHPIDDGMVMRPKGESAILIEELFLLSLRYMGWLLAVGWHSCENVFSLLKGAARCVAMRTSFTARVNNFNGILVFFFSFLAVIAHLIIPSSRQKEEKDFYPLLRGGGGGGIRALIFSVVTCFRWNFSRSIHHLFVYLFFFFVPMSQSNRSLFSRPVVWRYGAILYLKKKIIERCFQKKILVFFRETNTKNKRRLGKGMYRRERWSIKRAFNIAYINIYTCAHMWYINA